MPWSRVVIIDEPNPEAVRIVREDLLDRFTALYKEAGAPEEAAVYYGVPGAIAGFFTVSRISQRMLQML